MPEFDDVKTDLVRHAREVGWKQALNNLPDADYLTDGRRAIFLDLLPIDGADVLEIGPGFGQFTDIIARRAKSVAALEVDAEQAEFIKEKVRQESLGNVVITTAGADCRLPYDDDSFDLVVLNLVLEWCATRLDEPHEEAQLRLLRETARVLRAGGKLYVSTKNRFALRYLIGKRDEHYHGMRFGSALPRWIADAIHARRSRGRLHSWQGLQKMLNAAGFETEHSWWSAPEMRFPQELVRVDAQSIKDARRRGVSQGQGRAERLLTSLLPAAWVKYFAPGLVFLSNVRTKNGGDTSTSDLQPVDRS